MKHLPVTYWKRSSSIEGNLSKRICRQVSSPSAMLFHHQLSPQCNQRFKENESYGSVSQGLGTTKWLKWTLTAVYINKLTSVFYASVLLLIMNFVITLSKELRIHEAIAEWIRRLLRQCYAKFMINNRTDALKTDVNLFFTTTNCRIAGSRSLTRRKNFKFMCLSVRILTIKISQ